MQKGSRIHRGRALLRVGPVAAGSTGNHPQASLEQMEGSRQVLEVLESIYPLALD